ncbi:DUF6588 family protein [Hyunsoonleella rubra]|uniref:DUF6588 family protein n=1 Tax=Hyunsoonleella rubra TaxID=1737062 RepID=A0ABW5TDB9_9FLAO
MKKLALFALFSLITITSKAQDLDALFAAGEESAERFTSDYLRPATNGLMHSMNAGWFNTADAKPLGGFEISIIANASMVKDEHKMFLLDLDTYDNEEVTFEFTDSSVRARNVATALGENNPDIDIIVRNRDFPNINERITLPSGLGDASANLLPTAFIQGALGISQGIELKARFVPKIKTDDVELGMFGAGVQFEVTKWLPADKLLPIAISGLVAYTNLNGSYDISGTSGVSGSDQRLENDTSTWLFQAIVSTKLPVINFYGGVGYIKGKSESDVLGTYTVTSGPFVTESYIDPFSVSSEVSDVRATIGTKLKVGFFRLNAEYHLSEFNAFSVGLNFGFR